MDIFQKRLIQLIENKNIGQKEVAEKTGITEATISRYITGKMKPTMKNAQLLADYFGVSIDYLSGGSGSPTTKNDYYINEDTAELAQEIFENPDLKILLSASRKLKKEDLETLIKLVDSMKKE